MENMANDNISETVQDRHSWLEN